MFHHGGAALRLSAPVVLLAMGAGLTACASEPGPAESDSQVRNAWVQVVPPDQGLLRAMTESDRCPLARFDGRAVAMTVRARPNPDFDVLVCELPVPRGTARIQVGGRELRPVSPNPRRIAVVGDTTPPA